MRVIVGSPKRRRRTDSVLLIDLNPIGTFPDLQTLIAAACCSSGNAYCPQRLESQQSFPGHRCVRQERRLEMPSEARRGSMFANARRQFVVFSS